MSATKSQGGGVSGSRTRAKTKSGWCHRYTLKVTTPTATSGRTVRRRVVGQPGRAKAMTIATPSTAVAITGTRNPSSAGAMTSDATTRVRPTRASARARPAEAPTSHDQPRRAPTARRQPTRISHALAGSR
jgi:hypothetical protein